MRLDLDSVVLLLFASGEGNDAHLEGFLVHWIFTLTDAPLSATLQFSTPLVNSISSLPEQQADISRKLKQTQQSHPTFGWDIEPVMGTEVIIEETFMGCILQPIVGDVDRDKPP